MFYVAETTINPDIVVTTGDKLNLRCLSNFGEPTWYKDGAELRRFSARMRSIKNVLKIKYVDAADAGVYACRVEVFESIEWRNVTVHVESPQNDSFQGGEESSSAMDTLRPEEETNDLMAETKSEFFGRSTHNSFANVRSIIPYYP